MKHFYVLWVIFLSLSSWVHIASAQNVNFPDANLAAKVRTELGLSVNVDIPETRVAGMTILDARALMISDITGLEYATNLISLELSSNSITDIGALSGLTSLETLSLASNFANNVSLSDISALSGLTSLTTLDLNTNKITDISALSGLTSLETLNLANNVSLSDISALSGLTSLTTLRLSGNDITDFSPVAWLSSLTPLDFTIPFVVRMNNVPAGVQTGAFAVDIEFNKSVSDFTADDISFSVGSAAAEVTNLTGSGTMYTATITPTEQGIITFKVPENVAFFGTVGNAASSEASVEVDLPPRITQLTYPRGFDQSPRIIHWASSNENLDAIIVLQVTFSENVSGFEATDIVLAGDAAATVSDLTNVSQSVYSIEVTILDTRDGQNDGSIIVQIPASSVEDNDHTPEGNTAYSSEAANTSVTIYYVPYVQVMSSGNDLDFNPLPPQNGPFNITFAFSEPMSGFTQQVLFNYVYTNTAQATITNWTVNADGNEYIAEFTPTTDGSVGWLAVAGELPAENEHGLRIVRPVIFSVEVDMTKPQVTLSGVPTDVRNDAFAVDIEFTEDVTGFVAADISLTGTASASVTSFTAESASQYTAEITPTTEGGVVIRVPADAAEDVATNGNDVSSEYNVTVDPVPPTVTIVVPPGQQSSVFEATIEFSESVTGFATSDISLTGTANATVTNLTGSGSTYIAEITSTSNGTVILQVPANIAEDAASNQNTASPSYTVQVDVTLPGVSLTGVPATPQNGVFNVSITFTENVTGFAASDISFTGTATATVTLTGTGSTYTAAITPTAEGDLVIQVPANTAQDAANNGNTASPSRTVTIDLTLPGVVLIGVPATPQNGVFNVSIAFTESVTGFAASDISFTGAATATATLTGTGSTYTAAITPTAEGDLVIQVPANIAEDAATNQNTASQVYTVTVDQTRPDVAIEVPADPQSALFEVSLTFTEPVTGFAAADISLTGTAVATVTNFTGSGSTYTAEITSEPNVAGNVTIQVPANTAEDAATNQNTASQVYTVVVDRTFPEVAIEVPGGPQSAPFEVSITFTEPVTGFEVADISLTGTAAATVTNFTGSGSTYTVEITPTTEGTVIIQVPESVVQDATTNANRASTVQLTSAFAAWMPDPNLRDLVREALFLDEKVIFSREELLDVIPSLNAEYREIENITGIQYATNLLELKLKGNAITDITPLAALTQLTTLDLSENFIIQLMFTGDADGGNKSSSLVQGVPEFEGFTEFEGISVFEMLTSLTKLDLGLNQIEELTPLERVKSLTDLNLRENVFEDINALENLTNLTALNLNATGIADIAPLRGLTRLTTLNLDDNSIDDIAAFAALTELRHLYLTNNQISDVSPLANLANLEVLMLSGNPVEDVTPLIGIASRIAVAVEIPPLVPDAALAVTIRDTLELADEERISKSGMRDLIVLYAPESDISNITGLEHATNLTELELLGNNISDISPLKGLTKLTILNLEENKITEVTSLVGLINLGVLRLAGNPILDARALAVLTEIDIDIDTTAIYVNIPDAGLAAALRAALGLTKKAGITTRALQGITTLDASSRKITQLTGLERATALTTLNLSNNSVSDVSVLRNLTQLTTLDLTNNALSNVTPLLGLVNLQTLRLKGNPIVNASTLASLPAEIEADVAIPDVIRDAALASAVRTALALSEGARIARATMQNLTTLSASESGITDLTGLAYANQLAELNLEDNAIVNVGGLPRLKSLTTLNLSHNSITDISGLGTLTALTTLNLSHNSITDISGLGTLTTLTTLALNNNSITDISGLGTLTALTTLALNDNSVSDISGLGTLTALTTLALNNNSVSDISVLSTLALTTLDLSNNSVNTLLPLKDLTSLTALALGGNNITDIGVLSGLTALTVLELGNNSISDIWLFQNLTALTTLDLSENAISNIGVLIGFTVLTELDLSGNTIENISPLQRLTTLTALDLSRNASLSNIRPLQELTKLRQLYLTENTVSDVTPLAGLVNLATLRLAANPIMDTSALYHLTQLDPPVDIDIEVSQSPPWDVNKDGSVDVSDSALVTAALGQSGDAIVNLRTDVNDDGIVNNADLLLVTENLDNTGTGAPSTADILVLLDSTTLESLDRRALETELNVLMAESDGSLKYQRAISMLRSVLAAIRPQTTQLLANYPNPFNPETWIPYQLASASHVSLTIYDARGAVVRQLALGHQPAGYYTVRTRAAYWDGRNAHGERVASGIYFYQLQADAVSTVRKMVILK